MKIIGIIPARYKSSRFEGKPLADIHGKPMIWWVYQQFKKVDLIDEIYVATDDERIVKACKELNMNSIMTSNFNETPVDRVYEVSEKIQADLYLTVLGDEPLIEEETIRSIVPEIYDKDKIYVGNLMTKITNAAEVIDFTNLKIVSDVNGKLIYVSRSPIPYPKGTLDIEYKKFVGVSIFSKSALDFFKSTPRGSLEISEDNDLIRFIENGIEVWLKQVETKSISVDTYKDLVHVRKLIK
jgi:3-deoxy-manno-octulosonate cytidylyltransferase (CMP-KDO synthetase)